MNIAGVPTGLVSSTGQSGSVQDVVAVKVLKESLDTQKQVATELINSVSQSHPSDSGSNVGQNIDTYA